MMEEVAIDQRTAEQSGEDEILACLVTENPKPKVLAKKAKLKEGGDRGEEENEDTLDKYQRENQQLLKASLRLEQENDSLAHRLVTSKIALRNSLDEAEDTVDHLMDQLQQTKQHLKSTQEDMRGKEEEAETLKDLFRRELEKAEQAIQKSSGIVADYKRICSQLNTRLEEEHAARGKEMEALKSAVKACPGCCHTLEEARDEVPSGGDGEGKGGGGVEVDPEARRSAEQYVAHSRQAERQREEQRTQREKEALELQIRGLEKELAQTKLQVVEANCTIQDMEHQNGLLSSDLQAAKNTWFSKTFTPRRASSGGIHSFTESRDQAPLAGWALPTGALSGWSAIRPAWLPKESREDL